MPKQIKREMPLTQAITLEMPYPITLEPHEITIKFVKNNFNEILNQVKLKTFYSIVKQAIYNHIRGLPKADLHAHLTGSYPLWYLMSLVTDAASFQEYQKFIDGIEKLAKGMSYSEAFECFKPIEKLVNTYEKVENGVIAIAQDLIKDGVVYIELRMGLKDLGKGHEEYLLAVLRGIEKSPTGVKINLLLSIRRDSSMSVNDIKRTIDLAIKYKDLGVVGIDISGDATLGDIKPLIAEINRAKEDGLRIALHLGESYKEIDTPEKEHEQADILEAIRPDRIGHGVFLSAQALKWVILNKRPIEICPTSSVRFNMIDDHNDHPGLRYYLKHNHPTVICTDDLVLFDSCLTLELYKLMTRKEINMREIHHMITRGFNYAFLTLAHKIELHRQFNQALEKSHHPRQKPKL